MQWCDYNRNLRPAKRGSGLNLHGSNPEPHMSALGQKRTCAVQKAMSALHPKATSNATSWNVRFGPKADSCAAANNLFDHLVGAVEQ
jgi:hypothetical protein